MKAFLFGLLLTTQIKSDTFDFTKDIRSEAEDYFLDKFDEKVEISPMETFLNLTDV